MENNNILAIVNFTEQIANPTLTWILGIFIYMHLANCLSASTTY